MDRDRGCAGRSGERKKARTTPERTAFLVHRQSAAAPRVTASIIATRGAYTPVIATRMRRLVAACSLPGCRLSPHADRIATSFAPPSARTHFHTVAIEVAVSFVPCAYIGYVSSSGMFYSIAQCLATIVVPMICDQSEEMRSVSN